jgi:hypothetical protein
MIANVGRDPPASAIAADHSEWPIAGVTCPTGRSDSALHQWSGPEGKSNTGRLQHAKRGDWRNTTDQRSSAITASVHPQSSSVYTSNATSSPTVQLFLGLVAAVSSSCCAASTRQHGLPLQSHGVAVAR